MQSLIDMSPRRRAPRRACSCKLADVLIFAGCAAAVLVCVGSARRSYVRAYEDRRQQAWDAVYGSGFWTDDCRLEHFHGGNSKPSHYNTNAAATPNTRAVSKGACTLG